MKKMVLVLFFVTLMLPLSAEECKKMTKCVIDAAPLKKSEAKFSYEYNGKTYYFCSEQCKTKFIRESQKNIKGGCSAPQEKPVMKSEKHNELPYVCCKSELSVENIPDGVIIKITSKNPQKVKEIQEFACKMVEQREAHQRGEKK